MAKENGNFLSEWPFLIEELSYSIISLLHDLGYY